MRLIKLSLLFFLGLIFFFSFKLTGAQETEICDGSSGECHYLRPYPAEPFSVSTSDLASYCGSDITVTQTITENYNPKDPNCKVNGNKITCSYNKTIESPITIDLKNANLPIMGNTEDVKNTVNEEDIIDNSEKVNEYVSWYLSGTNFKKEYGFPNPTENLSPESQKELLNYSGPLAKLLPQEIQFVKRIETIEKEAGKDINKDGITQKQERHDQAVVCTKNEIDSALIPPTIEWALEKLGIGPTKSVACPEGEELKISSWTEGDLSFFNSVIEGYISLVDVFINLIPSVTGDIIQRAIDVNIPWNSRFPPLSWETNPADGRPFDDLTYRKAYNEWRGKTCILIPFPRILVCAENYLVPNKYADMFSYIPLSSTEDTKGQVKIDSPNFTNQSPADLFFAHIEESSELASSLQDTFIYKDGEKTGTATRVETNPSCNQVEVRSNKGDNLFAGQIAGNLKYNATYTCDYSFQAGSHNPKACLVCSGKSCLPNPNKGSFCNSDFNECNTSSDCTNLPGYVTDDTCTKTVQIQLSTKSYTPKADNLWSQLVSGPTSIFKRIFPKLGGETGTLKDIAGSTSVDIQGGGANSTGELKFPHLGGISEYFLKGIQTALRPKGYGEPISFGETTDIKTSGEIDCDQSAPDISLPKTVDKEKLHQIAIKWQGREGDKVLECYNDVARKSLTAGINPAFTFFMWINESGGSNYEISNQDWGINSSSVVGFNAQLERFLGLTKGYKNTYPQCFGKGRTDTQVFFDLFTYGLQGGNCPQPDSHYLDIIDAFWGEFTSCPFVGYPFSASCY